MVRNVGGKKKRKSTEMISSQQNEEKYHRKAHVPETAKTQGGSAFNSL